MPDDGRAPSPDNDPLLQRSKQPRKGAAPVLAAAGAPASSSSAAEVSSPISHDQFRFLEQKLLQSQCDAIASSVQLAMAASTAQVVAAVTHSVSASTSKQISALEKKCSEDRRQLNDSMSRCETSIERHGDTLQKHDRELAAVHAKLDRLQVDLGKAVSAPAPIRLINSDYDRPIDFSILKVRTKLSVPKEGVQGMVDALAAKVSIDPNIYKIVGESPGRQFEVRFQGAPSVAARSAARVLSTLNLGGGKWEQLEVILPDESVSNAWLDIDKNAKTIFIEKTGKHFRRIAAEASPSSSFIWRRRDAVLFIEGWKTVAKLDSTTPGEIIVKWAEGSEEGQALREAGVARLLQDAVADPAEKTRWV